MHVGKESNQADGRSQSWTSTSVIPMPLRQTASTEFERQSRRAGARVQHPVSCMLEFSGKPAVRLTNIDTWSDVCVAN